MTKLAIILLIGSIVLSTLRNILSKSISFVPAKNRNFYLLQGIVFLCGAIFLFVIAKKQIPDGMTMLLSFIYGILLISAQWNYTSALQAGDVGICATVYSLGFIFPTLSGAVLYDEKLSVAKIFGILLVIIAIVISNEKKTNSKIKTYYYSLLAAMISSGGLGIVQKIQQNSPVKDEKTMFVAIAFALACLFSFVRCLFSKENTMDIKKIHWCIAGFIGLCFASCNTLNTQLAGMLESAVFFPILNIGTILFSLFISFIAFREKITIKKFFILLLGIVAIILMSF